jgi:hypothetical protein
MYGTVSEYGAVLAQQHIDDLRRAADADRLARTARPRRARRARAARGRLQPATAR